MNGDAVLDVRLGERETVATSPLTWVLGAAFALKVLYLAQYLRLPFLYGPLFDAQVYLLQARRVLAGEHGDASLLAFSPLYGYLLAALRAHQASLLPVLLQLLLGLANIALIHRITARVWGHGAAVAAAVLYVGYGPLMFFETKIMSETVGMSLLLLGLALLETRALGAGVCIALAVLARASLLPALPLLAVASWLGGRSPRLLRFGMALALTLGAHGLWTQAHSGIFVPVIMVSNTAARATQAEWTGDLSVFQGRHEEAVSAFSVVRQAQARLDRAHRGEPEPAAPPFSVAGYLTQAPSKLWATFRDRETSFDYGYYGERTEIWALRVPFVSFGSLCVLALGGALLGWRDARRLAPLIAVALGTLLTTTMFHPSTRYRLPLIVLLLPLAGHAIERLRRSRRGLGLLLVCGLGFGILQASRGLEHPGMWQLRLAEASLEEGDFAAARARVATARTLEPGDRQVQLRAEQLSRRLPVRLVSKAALDR